MTCKNMANTPCLKMDPALVENADDLLSSTQILPKNINKSLIKNSTLNTSLIMEIGANVQHTACATVMIDEMMDNTLAVFAEYKKCQETENSVAKCKKIVNKIMREYVKSCCPPNVITVTPT